MTGFALGLTTLAELKYLREILNLLLSLSKSTNGSSAKRYASFELVLVKAFTAGMGYKMATCKLFFPSLLLFG
jgi:hypothetical protein